MSNCSYTCPHCEEPVIQTMRHNIAGHYTPAGTPCPASLGTPFAEAIEHTTTQPRRPA